MQKGFWDDMRRLGRPFVALAPMANVTDAAFRCVIVKYGKPDVMWTEFVSADGLCSAGRERLLPDLWFTEVERPIVAQLFTGDLERMKRAAALIRELGFDGLDINMGCPDRAVEKQGAGAALMKDPARAVALVRAAQEGAGGLPVSVKTRIGYRTNDITDWLPRLLEAEPAAITIHARTRNEMSKVPAQWRVVAEVAAMVKEAYAATPDERPLVIGNGDVVNVDDAEGRTRGSGADGAMVGRGIFGNPWFFDRTRSGPPETAEKLRVMVEHTWLFEQLFRSGDRPLHPHTYLRDEDGNGLDENFVMNSARVSNSQTTHEHNKKYPRVSVGVKNFDVMKKHYVAYVSGFPGAKELRAELMNASTAEEVANIVAARYPETVPGQNR